MNSSNSKSERASAPNLRNWALWVVAAVIGAIIVVAYLIAPTNNIGSVGQWLWLAWEKDPDYSHGFLVPLISLGLVIYKWRELPSPTPDAPWLGIVGLATAMTMYWVGVRAQIPHLAAMSLIALGFGLALFFGGWQLTKKISFALAFLLFMVPMRFLLDPIAFELRMIVSIVATVVLNIVGIDAVRTGTSINPTPSDPTAALEVADPCSGIRSLVMLSALASLYGYLTLDKLWKKWTLFFVAAPIAVAANVVRITTIAMISRAFGYGAALKVYHDYSGFIVFAVSVILVVGVSLLINGDYGKMLKQWLNEPVPTRRRAVAHPSAPK
jgi:exosortase